MIWSYKNYDNLDFTFKEKLHFQGYSNKMRYSCDKMSVVIHTYRIV